ncbi:MAG: hypothetical protein Q7S92_05895 [Candidatus Diapherotrites archaeon]|nr:hypothetical protein [Candidatus Diapherotrites archaeon]
MVKIQESKGKYFITLPKNLVRLKKYSKGTELQPMFNEKGNIELIKIR